VDVPNLADAKKRMKQNERRRERNRARASALKTETRKLADKLGAGDVAGARAQYVKLTKKLDQTAAKGSMHKNTAARRKSRLAKRLNATVAAGKK
jgi:small subunit ribosomal protein S20